MQSCLTKKVGENIYCSDPASKYMYRQVYYHAIPIKTRH